jgi:radical SAM/Cys-rich protein
MQDTNPLLLETDFPQLTRNKLDTLQVNLGYRCNLSCTHCHVNAGPQRTEMMSRAVVDQVLQFAEVHGVECIDLTGGAPEMNPHFRYLVTTARQLGIEVIDRCNLTILLEPGYEDLAAFLAQESVRIVASLPCYLEDNVNQQRGNGVFQRSIEALAQLNELGYGRGAGLELNLVYNPIGAYLPPPQAALQADYKSELRTRYGLEFDQLFTITNMPISRFGAVLLSQGEFGPYMQLLKDSFSDANLAAVMCRNLISVDWCGYVYDCDFNQMIDLPLRHPGLIASNAQRTHIGELAKMRFDGAPIRVGEHCYGCTAGQGSSCGGALD